MKRFLPFISIVALSVSVCNAETPALFLEQRFDCKTLAEAVNHFVAIGEQSAVHELKMLAKSDEPDRKRGFSRSERIGWVCRILFDSKGDEPLRPPGFGGLSLPWKSMPLKNWPIYPLANSGSTYFILSQGYSLNGLAEPVSEYIDYCQAGGNFRTKPLTIPTIAQARKDLAELRQSESWKAIKWKDSGLGWSYTISEKWVVEFIAAQTQLLPAK